MGGVLGLEPLAPVRVAVRAARNFGQEDGRLGRIALGEDDPVFAVPVRPVLQQVTGYRRDARVLTAATPLGNIAADVVDKAVLLPTLPGRVEIERLLLRVIPAPTLSADRDRDERLARSAPVLDLPGRPL
jgi:hypothetical protein